MENKPSNTQITFVVKETKEDT